MPFSFTSMFEQVGKMRIKSITDSLFLYGLLTLIVGVTASLFPRVRDWELYVLFGLGLILMLTGLISYIYFAKKNPDYLRSENYQLKKQSLVLLGDKENQFNPNMKEVSAITNPYAKDKGKPKDFEI